MNALRLPHLLVATATLGLWVSFAGEALPQSAQETETVPRETEAIEAPEGKTAPELLGEGDRLAREKRYGEALEAWAQAYYLKLPEYRKLSFRRPVTAQFLDRDALRRVLLENLGEDYPDEEIAADRIALSALGYFPPDLDLKEVLLDVLTEEIAGFYDPETEGLYLIDASAKSDAEPSLWKKLFGGGEEFVPAEQKSVLSHEMAHALADQHFDLYTLSRPDEQDDDELIAASALTEGEAMLVMLMDGIDDGKAEADDLLAAAARVGRGLLDELTTLSLLFGAGQSYRRAPAIVKESLIFPYTKGVGFTAHLAQEGGWEAVDAAFRAPPVSSEQILHPEKYLPETRDDPVRLRLPDGGPLEGSWELVESDVAGEFGIEVLLRPELGSAGEGGSVEAAEGWDGDVYAVFRPASELVADSRGTGDPAPEEASDPDGRGPAAAERVLVVWVSTWDSEEDAREFEKALAARYDLTPDGSEETEDEEGEAIGAGGPDAAGKDGAGAANDAREAGPADHADGDADGVERIVRRGRDVVFLGGVPEEQLDRVRAWSLRVEREPKEVRERRIDDSESESKASPPPR